MEMLMITAARVPSGTGEPTHLCVGLADSESTTWKREPAVQPVEEVLDAIEHGHRAMIRKPAGNGFSLGPEIVKQALSTGGATIGFKAADATLRDWSDLPTC